jgi:hypothetical protein
MVKPLNSSTRRQYSFTTAVNVGQFDHQRLVFDIELAQYLGYTDSESDRLIAENESVHILLREREQFFRRVTFNRDLSNSRALHLTLEQALDLVFEEGFRMHANKAVHYVSLSIDYVSGGNALARIVALHRLIAIEHKNRVVDAELLHKRTHRLSVSAMSKGIQ